MHIVIGRDIRADNGNTTRKEVTSNKNILTISPNRKLHLVKKGAMIKFARKLITKELPSIQSGESSTPFVDGDSSFGESEVEGEQVFFRAFNNRDFGMIPRDQAIQNSKVLSINPSIGVDHCDIATSCYPDPGIVCDRSSLARLGNDAET
ncbi:hypothetical protein HQ35_05390 [Porphyromonas cangingivalis]|uniref:Uncharacterized protein n=1 Tax=Porphyromonas cangingivalis TaxID=36874 RepID=A0A0A2ERY8_PORCN|nr:hypothetical protein HQ35_05390 [Porphyromonas cangingivalis]